MKLLLLGESGSGKSYSLRTLDWSRTFLISTTAKELPFRDKNIKKATKKEGNMLVTIDSDSIVKTIAWIDKSKPEIKTIVIDDAQYIMVFEYMKRAKEKGYDKFTEIAQNFFNILMAADSVREDLDVIFLSHTVYETANGFRIKKMKTIGKMLDDLITIEGLFTTVLTTDVNKVDNKIEYTVITQSDGFNVSKSPIGMYNLVEPNDMQYLITKAKSFYEHNPK